MFTTAPALVLPRTAPCEEPINTELPEVEAQFDSSIDEMIDPEDSLPDIEMLGGKPVRGPAVRAPIYASPESRPERTLPRAVREQIAAQKAPVADTQFGDDPFAALMGKFAR